MSRRAGTQTSQTPRTPTTLATGAQGPAPYLTGDGDSWDPG
ncbi:hypothetical protein [Streptomyces clavuligerus]|nr:hypothetical protein [Streptomyces clavuligerus]